MTAASACLGRCSRSVQRGPMSPMASLMGGPGMTACEIMTNRFTACMTRFMLLDRLDLLRLPPPRPGQGLTSLVEEAGTV